MKYVWEATSNCGRRIEIIDDESHVIYFKPADEPTFSKAVEGYKLTHDWMRYWLNAGWIINKLTPEEFQKKYFLELL